MFSVPMVDFGYCLALHFFTRGAMLLFLLQVVCLEPFNQLGLS